ncbi:hypothetical protein B296_00036258 [Ensete ventricosum]|uniref:Uncharacterized protein n=1 Tax=Ensete ventricosum TaxID=4639 RepID=A0A426X2T3_ENSVE|nr:hypothetical protein B296_00036258 [Ensete ventricosum]
MAAPLAARAAPCQLVTSGNSLRRRAASGYARGRPPVGYCPCGLALATSNRPLAGGLGYSRSPLCRRPWPQSTVPLQVARLWPVAPAQGVAMVDHPCR